MMLDFSVDLEPLSGRPELGVFFSKKAILSDGTILIHAEQMENARSVTYEWSTDGFQKNNLRSRDYLTIYLKEGEAELQKTAEYVLRTIEDNLKSLIILFNEIKDQTEDSAETYNLQARLLTFACTTAEKLLLLNLYARNPLLLVGEKELKRDHLFRDFNYKNYDMNWLFNRSSGFVKPQVMWDTLSAILLHEGNGRLDDLETDFLYLKDIRNKYLHVFIIKVDPKSFYLVRDFVWVLLIRLFDALPNSLSVNTDETLQSCGCDIDLSPENGAI